MDFFEHQDRARRRTRRLLTLFVLAVVAIIAVVNLIVLFAFGQLDPSHGPLSPALMVERHGRAFLWTTLITGAVIGFASLFRSLSLSSGGGVVARELGGTPVDANTTDPLHRRLLNVVEEMAIAAGVPVPEIYVLEREQGINAFAAGYSPADAAVAVTRGTLENLSRAELQGVVAHEFGHILNGDMRLNIRLIGLLFGILALAMIGRRLLFTMRYSGSRREGGGIAILGLALVAVGYIGLFFGRWIKASVSRQREYLADASAVQFTRQPEGIAGALKKIGAIHAGSRLEADTEEVGHLLFAQGFAARMFATHPPLVERIRAIDPGFDPAEIKTIRAHLQRHSEAKVAAREDAGQSPSLRGAAGLAPAADSLIRHIGRPGPQQALAAAVLTRAIPRPLARAAHSNEWAAEVICYLLMDRNDEIRERQLLMVARALGLESEGQLRTLLRTEPDLAAQLRIPLLEITFPALRRRSREELVELMTLVDRLIHADGRVDVFEYALARLLAKQIEDILHPSDARSSGRHKVKDYHGEVRDVLGILARHGHDRAEAAEAALGAGLQALELAPEGRGNMGNDWPARLDTALSRLDGLRMDEKERLVRAMLTTVTHDGTVEATEMELLRVICAWLGIPMPALAFDSVSH